jgi:hypothetical protein
MHGADTADSLWIADLGEFRALREKMLGLYAFERSYTFRGQEVALIVYPNDDETWPSVSQRAELVERLRAFEASIDSTLHQLPKHLITTCLWYGFEVEDIEASRLATDLEWTNVKLESNGEIECYTRHEQIPLDIVIRFASPSVISKVNFDG